MKELTSKEFINIREPYGRPTSHMVSIGRYGHTMRIKTTKDSQSNNPDAGMTFEIPKITAVPTVGEEAEAAAIDETGMTNNFLTVNVKKFAGGQTFSVELLDRSNALAASETFPVSRNLCIACLSCEDFAWGTEVPLRIILGAAKSFLFNSGLLF